MEERKYAQRSKRRHGGLKLALVFCLILELVNCMDVEIENMRREGIERHEIGFFVEDRVEFVHSKISLRPLLNGLHNFDKMNLEFGTRATSKFGKFLKTKIDKISNRIQSKAENLYGKRVEQIFRNKRAIEFIGNLISKAFGNPGPEDMKKITANFIAMKKAIERQRDNSLILHRDVDKEKHDVERQNVILKQLSVELFRNENSIDQIQAEMLELQGYLELEAISEAIDEILESLSDIKRDAKVGRCNLKGLNRDFLIDNLRDIESNKLGIAPVFASWEWEKYYQFEMCSIALHKDDLWVTMRIPIIKPNEKMFRTLPSSSQIWIRRELYNIGIDISFFKEQNHEIYSVITNTNFDLCNIMGTTRVCNVRKTTFREQSRYVVPVEITTNRILILSNETSNETITMNSCCEGKNSELQIESWSMLRVPSFCEIKNKNLAIEIKSKSESISSVMEFESVDKIEFRKIAEKTKSEGPIEIPSLSEDKESHDSKEFEKNDELTKNELDKVSLISQNHEGIFNEFMAVKVGGLSSTICIVVVLLVIVIIMCRKKCRSQRMNERGVSVNVNLEKNENDEKNYETKQNTIDEGASTSGHMNEKGNENFDTTTLERKEKRNTINEFN